MNITIASMKPMTTFVETVAIEAPPRAVWAALADIGNISEWNPGVVSSRKTTEGETQIGARRHCDLGGRNYLNEEVVEWAPQRALTMRIIGTNLPFEAAAPGAADSGPRYEYEHEQSAVALAALATNAIRDNTRERRLAAIS